MASNTIIAAYSLNYRSATQIKSKVLARQYAQIHPQSIDC